MDKKPTARAWPADSVERWPIGKLLAYPQNPMVHTDTQIERIAASIQEHGWTMPALVDETGVLICGHARVRAAQTLGITEIPTMVARGWTEAQKKSYRIADNQLPRLADFDVDLLRLELTDLEIEGYDLNLTGFDDVQLVQFMANIPTGGDPEATPDPPANPVTKRGDLWLLGNHRLCCGDATSAEDVERLLDGAKPHLMVTDPPYGVEYDPDWRNRAKRAGTMEALGASAIGTVTNDERPDWRDAWALFPGDVAYVWCASWFLPETAAALRSCEFDLRNLIIWAKQHAAISRGHYHWQHEPCWYGVRVGKTAHWGGDRKQTTVWDIANANAFGGEAKLETTGHSTQKPIECMKRPIENNSRPGDAVYDPFLGSGTTLIAAEMTTRKCYGLEIDAGYCDVIVQRWQTFTSKEAVLDAPGKPTYARVQADRAKPATKRKRAPRAVAAE